MLGKGIDRRLWEDLVIDMYMDKRLMNNYYESTWRQIIGDKTWMD